MGRVRPDESIDCPHGMVYVPPGWFVMGCGDNEQVIDFHYPEQDYLAPSKPQRLIFLNGFFIDVLPVTCGKYQVFLEETGYYVPVGPFCSKWNQSDYWELATRTCRLGFEQYPVIVTFYDALAYCEWLGKRLPYESEWEKAARGTDGRPFPWGWDTDFVHRGNFFTRSLSPPDEALWLNLCPVDLHPAGISPYGCLDMLGNAPEWCADRYSDTYYARMPIKNPRGPRSSKHSWRVIRGIGGGFSYSSDFDPLDLHIAHRDAAEAWAWAGFRCALSVR